MCFCSIRREDKMRRASHFGGIADNKSFSTRLGDSFRGFLFGGGGPRGEDGSVGLGGAGRPSREVFNSPASHLNLRFSVAN